MNNETIRQTLREMADAITQHLEHDQGDIRTIANAARQVSELILSQLPPATRISRRPGYNDRAGMYPFSKASSEPCPN